MFTSPFGEETKISIPEESDIVFVSDLFTKDYTGGAELTTDALIDASPYNVFRLHSRDVNNKTLSEGVDKFWIFGNFSQINPEMFPSIIGNINYSILEYDYKFCKYRSVEKHFAAENKECDCPDQMHGKMMSAFFFGSKKIWWMSEKQRERYISNFPFLSTTPSEVLSSVFDENTFKNIQKLVKAAEGEERKGYIVLGSDSWIKGAQDAIDHCEENGLQYEVVWNLPYEDVLEKLSRAEGFVYLPRGGDTCPRMVIEAMLLGCNLVINENVQHATESWFSPGDMEKTLNHLYFARERFWKGIRSIIEYEPTISGYTTTLNCIRQNYPFEASIKSLLGFCNQVVIVDGGSDDGTWEKLEKIAKKNKKVIIHRQERDWSHKRFAVFDGLQKALARAICTSEFCWQQDSDEIVHERDYEKIKSLMKQIPRNMDLVGLPVIEFWGGPEKVRLDINPWKWRLSRNRPHITHGIPSALRKYDEEGNVYASPGTDGCDYIRNDNFEPIPFASFYTEEAHITREKALSGDKDALQDYGTWFSQNTSQLPSVYHYSWFNLERKIKTYRDYWSKHWQSLYDIKQEDTGENNMFFDKPWSEVTESDISSLSSRLKEEMGGWIFHQKIDFSKRTPSLILDHDHPKFIKKWIKK